MPRTIDDKLTAITAATAARIKAEADEAAAINSLTSSTEAGEDVLANGEMIADLDSNFGYAAIAGNVIRLKVRGYRPSPNPTLVVSGHS